MAQGVGASEPGPAPSWLFLEKSILPDDLKMQSGGENTSGVSGAKQAAHLAESCLSLCLHLSTPPLLPPAFSFPLFPQLAGLAATLQTFLCSYSLLAVKVSEQRRKPVRGTTQRNHISIQGLHDLLS